MKLLYFKSKYFINLFFVSILLVVSFYFILSSYSYKMGLEIYNGWKESAAIELQQGNYLSSITKAQRSLMSSGQLVGISLYDLKSGRELIQYGTTSRIEKLPEINTSYIHKRGLFSFAIAESLGDTKSMIIQFDFYPKIIWIVFLSLLGIIVIFSFLLWFQIQKIEKNEFKERETLINLAIKDLIQNEKLSDLLVERLPFLVAKWVEIKSDLARAQEIHSQALLSLKMSEIAQQVSHDIRSPLSALNMMLVDLKELPEQKRVIVRSALQRINDISNSLLEKSKGQVSPVHNETSIPVKASTSLAISASEMKEVVLLSSVVGELLSEKRIQFREKMGVVIEEDLTKAYGYFALASARELKRILSNLINNSMEALPQGQGRITVGIRGYKDLVQVIISDNGKGIPASVLEKLGQRGVSHGKEDSAHSGSGLGVYHAKSTIESWGGKFEIQSREGHGTLIQMQLPRAKSPTWFLEELCLKPDMAVYSVDDDLSIHGIWSERLKAIAAEKHGVTLRSSTSAKEFMNIYEGLTPEVRAKSLYLVDYEFLNQGLNGLQVIEKLGIASQAILVTSRYEESSLQRQCQELGVKILPKTLAGFVPMVLG